MSTTTDRRTLEESKQEIRRLLDWIDWVPEEEYTASEQARMIHELDRTSTVLQTIASKYND